MEFYAKMIYFYNALTAANKSEIIMHFDCIKVICTQTHTKVLFVSHYHLVDLVPMHVNQTLVLDISHTYKFKLAYYFGYFFISKKLEK